ALEVEAARLAALRRTDEDLDELTDCLAARDGAVRRAEGDTAISIDSEFHRRVVAASHNPVLISLYEGTREAIVSSVAATFDPGTPPDQRSSHTGLLEAIRDGDPATAAAEAGGFLDEMLEQLA